MRRTVRSASPLIVVLAAVLGAGCGAQDAAPTVVSPSGTVTQTVVRAGASEAEKIAVIRLCKQVITSAGVMVRDYNAFIKRLNDVQDYAEIGSERQWAVDTLDSGADLVRKAVVPDVPERIDTRVQDFVTSSERLAEQIGGQRKAALNRASDDWERDRTALLDSCSDYLPAGG